MHHAYDSLSEGQSVAQVASTLSRKGKMAIVCSREDGAWKADSLPLEPVYGTVWEGLSKSVQYQGFTAAELPVACDFDVGFYMWLSVVWRSEIYPVPFRLMPGELKKVVDDGFALLGAGGMKYRQVRRTEEWMRLVSAEKLEDRMIEVMPGKCCRILRQRSGAIEDALGG